MKTVNVLIIDDNPLVHNCVKGRIMKCNAAEHSSNRVNIVPHVIPLNALDGKSENGKKIGNEILNKSISILLIDRGFFEIIQAKTHKESYTGLNSKKVYASIHDEGYSVEEILCHIPKNASRLIEKIIVYTYDSKKYRVEPELIRKKHLDIFNHLKRPDVEVLLANTDVYSLSKTKLYKNKVCNKNQELKIIGTKKDFILYGLFVGEILYHRMVAMLTAKFERELIQKRKRMFIYLPVLYLIFICLSLGTSALFEILTHNELNMVTLMVLSIFFSVMLPVLILITKPHWLLDLFGD